MRTFVTLLKRRSPRPQLANFGHGWIELPNGQRWQPAPGAKIVNQARRRSWICRLWSKGGYRG